MYIAPNHTFNKKVAAQALRITVEKKISLRRLTNRSKRIARVKAKFLMLLLQQMTDFSHACFTTFFFIMIYI